MKKTLKKTLVALLTLKLLLSSNALSHEAKNENLDEKKLFRIPKIHENFDISGLLELEAYTLKRDGGDSDSDLVLATFQLDTEFRPTKFISLFATFLFEEDETEPMDLDEAYILLKNNNVSPFYLKLGKFYIPFGNFETNMISDPLTLELAETNQSTLQLGFDDFHGLSASVFAFNGDVGKNDDYDRIKYGLNIAYQREFNKNAINLGISYTSDLLDSDFLEEWVKELKHHARHDKMRAKIKEDTPAISLYSNLSINDFTIYIEYITQLKDTKYTLYDRKTRRKIETIEEDKFSAWHIEASYTQELFSRDLTFSIAYQGTNNLGDSLPENRYLATLSYDLLSGINTKVEYTHNDFKEEMDENVFTAQLSISF